MRAAHTATDPHGIGALPPAEIRLGMHMWYYPTLPAELDTGVAVVVRSEPWQLGSGHWVVKVQGRAGGVSTAHLRPRHG
ncbi:MAG TPA: hypothetical protein VGB13_05595 [Candidatus Krumholzibacteria bacterium]